MNDYDDNLTGTAPTTDHEEARPDLSSTHVREDVALAGHCANVHLPTGRTCTLPVRHPGSCRFVGPEDAQQAAVS
ncbi:MAG: hypothetical protein JWM01_479 [Arthrobacter sp.]|jgi:hypothetical protein|nr:hypothetical protein [Arthrobacter sp.]MCU1523042.1 hypothetical protein [Arthrobacter sp.]MCU1539532.1 hypothetical protein [Arthrobacter sp.]MCU1555900.1 hypothetical protein [Arthrobacter sp.]